MKEEFHLSRIVSALDIITHHPYTVGADNNNPLALELFCHTVLYNNYKLNYYFLPLELMCPG